MKMDIKISDESGDKKYFTIIPNYILNHSTLWDREVYIQMKRIAGENGTCWTSLQTLASQCGIGLTRLKKSIKYLSTHNWIQKIGIRKVETEGGSQAVNEYKVVDLWSLNAKFYQDKGGSSDEGALSGGLPLSQRGVAKGGSPGVYKEEPIKEEPFNIYKRNWEKLVTEYIPIKDVGNKTNQNHLKKFYKLFKGDIEKLKFLLEAVKHFSESSYPYTIYSVGSLWEKKEKILARLAGEKQRSKKEEVNFVTN